MRVLMVIFCSILYFVTTTNVFIYECRLQTLDDFSSNGTRGPRSIPYVLIRGSVYAASSGAVL